MPLTFHDANFMFHIFPSVVVAADEKSIAVTSGIGSLVFFGAAV